jgi:hypothetical protein
MEGFRVLPCQYCGWDIGDQIFLSEGCIDERCTIDMHPPAEELRKLFPVDGSSENHQNGQML